MINKGCIKLISKERFQASPLCLERRGEKSPGTGRIVGWRARTKQGEECVQKSRQGLCTSLKSCMNNRCIDLEGMQAQCVIRGRNLSGREESREQTKRAVPHHTPHLTSPAPLCSTRLSICSQPGAELQGSEHMWLSSNTGHALGMPEAETDKSVQRNRNICSELSC